MDLVCFLGTSAVEAEGSHMYYFYVLQFDGNRKLYKGFTSNLRKRVKAHKSGKSKFTSLQGIFKLIFYEAYLDEKDAREAERYFKTGHGRKVLKEKLKSYLGEVA